MELKKKAISLESPYGRISLLRNVHGTVEVHAGSEAALYYGQGFAQMNDRQLQAFMLKIIFSGRAAELLNPKLVAVDEYIRAFPFLPEPEKELARLSRNAAQNLQAFCDGCNIWFDENKPRWEWKLVGFQPDRWEPADVLRIVNAFGFVGLTDLHVMSKKFIIQLVRKGTGEAELKSLFPGIRGKIDYELIRKIKTGPELVPPEIKWLVPSFSASNNWVVSPEKTGSAALFANDPHLQIDRLPAIWQETVLDLSGRRFIGYSVPGIPGPVTGRTTDLAWGPTYSVMDMLEYRIEEIRNGKYRRGNNWLPLNKRTEEIRVKKGKPVLKDYWETDHGLLEGYNEHRHSDGFYLSLYYSAARDTGAAELTAMFEMFHCTSVKDGMEKYRQFESPSFNWVLADKSGNIGYQMTGRAIDRSKGTEGLVPESAWDKGPVCLFDRNRLPSAYNPKEGYIVTANEDMSRFSKCSVQTIPMASYRADRITALLSAGKKLTLKDMQDIQLDLYSLQAELFLQQARPYLAGQAGGQVLLDWDCRYDAESTGAVCFERYYRKLVELVFCGQKRNRQVFDYLWDETNAFNFLFGFFDRILLQDETPWFSKEEKAAYIQAALKDSLSRKPVKMKQYRKVMMKHVFFGNVLPSFLGFDHGPVFFGGSRATVNQGQFFRSAGMDTSFCPSFRLVADMKENAAYTNYVGGATDRRYSRLYLNDLKNYLRGIYRRSE
ncbi:MAG: penicillin acylase family protein [Spirochaetales bacterium]|nr:penicillin acylase family protein [Spirochaetales bacterium]